MLFLRCRLLAGTLHSFSKRCVCTDDIYEADIDWHVLTFCGDVLSVHGAFRLVIQELHPSSGVETQQYPSLRQQNI